MEIRMSVFLSYLPVCIMHQSSHEGMWGWMDPLMKRRTQGGVESGPPPIAISTFTQLFNSK